MKLISRKRIRGHNFAARSLKKAMERKNYLTLGFMLIVSFVTMYGVMFLNVDEAGHIYLSLTRLYMTLLMISPMPLIMIAFMRKMYDNKTLNAIICAMSVLIMIFAFQFLRNQTFISEKQYIQAMIPHHSSAIMTNKHAALHDSETKALSESIIKSQNAEIEQMKRILQRIK